MTIQFAAGQLSSSERLELMYWLESILGSAPSNDLAAKVLANSGSGHDGDLAQVNEGDPSDYLVGLKGWIAEVELQHVAEGCDGLN